MYELVNTSLPNGLIAGTHGFATVAMTKGVPDILRGRLEALCAYTHRTSVHDATYYQQNPVNWFHVTLPQGEHVVGRVAPSDFDYTGRTNRLARLRVFSVNEMPAVGGAEILAREKHWFVQPWQGDPRYLDEDRNTCGHLRMINPARFSDAPAWNSVFGSGGLRYAQQVAWQIEKNLASGGKTIYFKTSTTWDASGEKLLGLFVDVINLLPVEMRPRVTFSTYPVSLPGGTGCSLRGIYDRDKSFDASSATQAWIDCENAKVVHAELLPTSGFDRKTETKNAFGSRDVGIGTTGQFRSDASAQRIGVRRGPSSGGDPYAYRNLIPPRKQGPDTLVVGLVIASLISLLAAGGGFLWWFQGDIQKNAEVRKEGRQAEDENGASESSVIARRRQEFQRKYELLKGWIEKKKWDYQSISHELDQLAGFSDVNPKPDGYQELIKTAQEFCGGYEEHEKIQCDVDNLRNDGTEISDSERERLKIRVEELKKYSEFGFRLEDLYDVVDKLPQKSPTLRQSKQLADEKLSVAKKDSDAEKRQNVAYLDAKEFRRGCPSYDYDSLKRKSKDPFMVEDGCCVYYYSGSIVTNEPAGFKVNKNMPSSAPLRWGVGLVKKLDDIPLVRNGFVLWYNPSIKCVYLDLNRRMIQNGDGEAWFSESTSVDLSQKYFGADTHFEEVWRKFRDNKKTKYLIDWKFNDKCRSAKPISTEKVIWTDVEMIAEMQKRAVKDYDDEIGRTKICETNLQNDLDKKLTPELKNLQNETNDMWKVCRAYRGESTKIENLKSEIEGLDKNAKAGKEKIKKKEKEIQECKRLQSNMLAEGTVKPTGERQKGLEVVYKNIDDLEKKIQNKEEAVDSKQKEIDKKLEQIEDAKKAVKAAEQSRKEFLEKFKDNIRKVRFTLRVEGETIED